MTTLYDVMEPDDGGADDALHSEAVDDPVIESPWTYAVTYLEPLYADASLGTETKLGSASGFFWRAGERVFLVSNWHVLSGRDPDDQQPTHDKGCLPNRLRVMVYKRMSATNGGGLFEMEVFGGTLTLLDVPDPYGPPVARWLEHPTLHRKADIAALDVTEMLQQHPLHFRTADELEHDAIVKPRAGDDAFVIGYPLGIVGGSPLPVWKRASVATEPDFDPGGDPLIYVDTATRAGMSGSIAIAKRTQLGPYTRRNGSQSGSAIAFIYTILGVYSGRIGEGELGAQLGLVWKRRLIDELVTGGCLGQTEMERKPPTAPSRAP